MNSIFFEVSSLTKKMRNTAYMNGKIQSNVDYIPFGASIRESIGPFPEFILKGRYCSRSMKGFCSPCFYSRLPINMTSEDGFNFGYEAQVKHIIEHFSDKVIQNQVGSIAHTFDTDKHIYSLVCTPTGSYFDSREYPVQIRKNNLKRLYNAMREFNCEIVLHIESHAEDIITYFSDPDSEEVELLQKLHARVLLGFESVNEVSRNAIYAKKLSLDDFQAAVYLLKEHNLSVGAFVFAGLFSLTEEETISDVNDSLIYLKSLDVSPVLMFANTQKYTIADVLLQDSKYKLLDSRTVYTIVKNVISVFGCNMNRDIDPWFIADPKGGPPDPNLHIFNAPTSKTCPVCSEQIYNAIENLRITKNIEEFLKLESKLNDCVCKEDYKCFINSQIDISLKESRYIRLKTALDNANKIFPYYSLRETPWRVKAELLCYGLNLTLEQITEISHTNPFIADKGFIDAVHILFGRENQVLVNLCVAEKFCKESPYSLERVEGDWILAKDNHRLGKVEFLEYPSWVHNKVDNTMIGKVVRPHSNKCISIWPSLDCQYVKENKACRFCSLNTLAEDEMVCRSPKLIAKMVKTALESNPNYEINLSGGTCISPEKSIEYLINVCQLIRQTCGYVPISVECVPPTDINCLGYLKASGATALIMNLEIYNNDLRKKICPGKGDISTEYYFKTLKKAVDLFGKGNVSSVLIVGIQPKEDIIIAAKKLIQINVIPTLIPFKPFDGTPMENHPTANPDEYISISRVIANEMMNNNLAIESNSGCAACGACSLETNLLEVYI